MLAHLAELTQIRDRTEGARQQIEAVLHAYAFLSRSGHGEAEAARLHQSGAAGHARHSLQAFLTALVQEGAATAVFRGDVAPEELAAFCVHALEASAELASPEAVLRLVNVNLDALRPPQPPGAVDTGR